VEGNSRVWLQLSQMSREAEEDYKKALRILGLQVEFWTQVPEYEAVMLPTSPRGIFSAHDMTQIRKNKLFRKQCNSYEEHNNNIKSLSH
jgi:hypothetical protein